MKFSDIFRRTAPTAPKLSHSGADSAGARYRDNIYKEIISGGGYSFVDSLVGTGGRDAILRNPTAYRCLDLISSVAISAKPVVCHRETGERVKPSGSMSTGSRWGRVARLMRNGIDPSMSNHDLFRAMVIDLLVSGNSYLWISGKSPIYPENIYLMDGFGSSVRAYRNEAKSDPTPVRVYYLRGYNGAVQKEVPARLVVHASQMNILTGQDGRILGVPALVPALYPIAITSSGDDYVLGEFQSGGVLQQMYYRGRRPLTESQRGTIADSMSNWIGSRPRQPGVFGDMGEDTIETISAQGIGQASPGLHAIRQFEVEEVARAFGVPLPLLGVKGSNMGTAVAELNRGFIRSTVSPLMATIAAAFTYTLLRDTNYEVKFMFPPSANSDIQGLSGAAALLGGTQSPPVLTVNEFRAMLGLPRLNDPKYDELMDPKEFHSGGMPPAAAPEPQPKPDEEPPPDEGDRDDD